MFLPEFLLFAMLGSFPPGNRKAPEPADPYPIAITIKVKQNCSVDPAKLRFTSARACEEQISSRNMKVLAT
jgi:hypothetical protein